MKLWAWLYTLIWTTALQIILGFYGAESLQTPVLVAHAAVGVAVLAVAQYDARAIRKTGAPDRLKRVARVSGIFAAVQFLLGLILFLGIELAIPIPGADVISFFHLLLALGILAQAASVATAYDMWEEKEFAEDGGPQAP